MDIYNLNIQYVTPAQLSKLPKAWGIYFFMDEQNFPLYIGMSNNLYNRLHSHFREKTEKKIRLIHQTVQIGYTLTTGFLTTALLESFLIKEFKPQLDLINDE